MNRTRWIRNALGLAACALGFLACSADAEEETTAKDGSGLLECGPEPHYRTIGSACLPSCGHAGGNLCLPFRHRYHESQIDVGPTWDCRYCYYVPSF